jgi:hypothetical protein
MTKVAYLAAVLAVATGSIASAAPPLEEQRASEARYPGTPAQQASCRPDVYRLCAGEIPNVRAITACLRRNQPRLSEGCAAVFAGDR